MTPQEKAKELVEKFSNVALLDDYESKQCALIAVDEIYKLKLIIGQHLEEFEDKENYYSYWEEVKKEIEKL